MPKAKTIDALLDAGATVPSSALNMATSATKSTDKAHTSIAMRDDVDLNARPDSAGVEVMIATDQDAQNEVRNSDETRPETYRPKRDGVRDDHVAPGAIIPKDKAMSGVSPANARNVPSRVSGDRKRQVGMTDVDKAKAHRGTLSNSKVIGERSQSKSGADLGITGPAKLNKKSAIAAPSQQVHQTKASVEASKGRPQRQAKQTAMGRLKAKHDKVGSDVDDMTDDSEDDGSGIFVQSKSAKKDTGRNEKAKHLPTPVTNGNSRKQTTETKSRGNLKSVKQQQNTSAASVKKPPNKRATRSTPAPPGRAGRPADTVTQKERDRQSTEAGPARSTSDHQTTAGTHNEQHKFKNTPSPRRPGALKRPSESFSRGRRQRREAPYDFPGSTPGTKKKARSISRASKVSTARAGPARQRMQSESVKERLDRANEGSKLPSISRQISPRNAESRGRLQKPSVTRRKKDDALPPPHIQAKSITQQREPHVLLPAQSSHATDAKSQSLSTGGRPAAIREKPGSSQAQAIVIEQENDSRSDSSRSPSLRRPTNTRSKATIAPASRQSHIKRPQTPAMMPSSPPGSGGGSIYTLANDKPTIISFSRQGPRNQGLSSAKKNPGSAAPPKVLSDYRSAKAGTPNDYAKTSGLATHLFPSSSQPPRKLPTQVTHTAQPSNVAKGDESVFGDFSKNGKNKALAHMLRQTSPVANERDQEDQDDGFAVIDDFEGTTLINDSEQSEQSRKPPTTSQVAMPPPDVAGKRQKDSKTASAPVQLVAKTAEKPGVSKDTPRPVPAQKAIDVRKVKEAANSVLADQVSKLSVEDETQGTTLGREITKTLPIDNAGKEKPLVGSRMVQQGQNPRKRGSAEARPGSPSKKIRVSRESMGASPEVRDAHVHKNTESQIMQRKEPTIRGDRRKSRVSRRPTQASQGVDILGSPYPKDLEVPTQTTALEVFSQQAGLSSDQMQRSDTAPSGRLDLKAVPRMVPSTKVGRVSSNGKPFPAAPHESSKAVTRIASGHLAEQLLAARSIHTSEDNPFTSSRERDSSAGQGLAATKFREALRQRGINLSDRPPAARSDEREDERLDDIEGTLVEPIDEAGKAPQHIARSPSASLASSASSPDAASKVLEDVGDWRNGLKPHQTHLFDSLVIAAHKLVRHMVDHETADRTLIADYRRRGEIIVDELQRAHAQEYQQYAQNVYGWKKQAADELAANGRKLKQSMRDAEKARAERKKAQRARNGFDGLLEGLVAELE
jgi:hypothetical protein